MLAIKLAIFLGICSSSYGSHESGSKNDLDPDRGIVITVPAKTDSPVAPVTSRSARRVKRQWSDNAILHYRPSPPSTDLSAESPSIISPAALGLQLESSSGSACITKSGHFGRCVRTYELDQCYSTMKFYSPLSYYQSLIMGMQDTCSAPSLAPSSSKHQVNEIGICCSDYRYSFVNPYPFLPLQLYPSGPTPFQIPVPDSSNQQKQPIPNWPPPIPTHPPDHTAPTHPPYAWPPTAPTHPPTAPPAFAPPATHPTWPPTTRPAPVTPAWPPSSTWPAITNPTTSQSTTTPPIIITQPSLKPAQWPTTKPDTDDLSDCGVKNGNQDQERIVGGQNADPNEWPWMAAILTSGRLFCGGSLIDSTHILTAAHCVAHMNSWDVAKLRVHLGDYNIKSKQDVKHIERKVKKVVRHRAFDPQTLYNDVALLTLDTPVTFTKNVRPICLPQGKAVHSGKTATVIGWGSLQEMGPTPGILQEVSIPVWTNTDCRSKYGPAAPGGIIESFLCAGKTSRDSCSGDSGGPLMVTEGKKWQQIGIVSWGIGCGKGQFPGVYTRISSFMPWISKNLNV